MKKKLHEIKLGNNNDLFPKLNEKNWVIRGTGKQTEVLDEWED